MAVVLHQKFTMHARLGKGGYLYQYDIVHDGKVVGFKSVGRADYKTKERTVYLLGTQEFDSAKAFREAYEKQIAPC